MYVVLHVLGEAGDQLLEAAQQPHHGETRHLRPRVVRVRERVHHVDDDGRTGRRVRVNVGSRVLRVSLR